MAILLNLVFLLNEWGMVYGTRCAILCICMSGRESMVLDVHKIIHEWVCESTE